MRILSGTNWGGQAWVFERNEGLWSTIVEKLHQKDKFSIVVAYVLHVCIIIMETKSYVKSKMSTKHCWILSSIVCTYVWIFGDKERCNVTTLWRTKSHHYILAEILWSLTVFRHSWLMLILAGPSIPLSLLTLKSCLHKVSSCRLELRFKIELW